MKDLETFKKGIKPIKNVIESRPGFTEDKLDSERSFSESLYTLRQEYIHDNEIFSILSYADDLLPFIEASVVLDEFGKFHGIPTTGRRGWENFLQESENEDLILLKKELDKNPLGINNMLPIVSLGPIMLQKANISASKIEEEAEYLQDRIISEYQEKEEYDETARVGIAEDVKLLAKKIVKEIIDHYSK